MSKSYFTEGAKMVKVNFPKWSMDECMDIHEILLGKGYFVNTVSRCGCDGRYHDALQVQREDVPQLVEQCFRQRLVAEYQAEGHGKANIIFVYDYHASTIIDAVRRFQRNKEDLQ